MKTNCNLFEVTGYEVVKHVLLIKTTILNNNYKK